MWWLADDTRLSERARAAIAAPASAVLVSAASIWEIAIKRALGRLSVPDGFFEVIEAERFEWLAVTAGHAWAAGALPDHHRDPFDRMLVAQAAAEEAMLVSADPAFDAYAVAVCW